MWLCTLAVAWSAATGVASAQVAAKTAVIHWQHLPFRDAMRRIENVFDDTLFIDRRIDPTTLLTLEVQADGPEAILAAIAASHDLGFARIGQLFYVGPPAAAARLNELCSEYAEVFRQLPRRERAAFLRKRRIGWARASEPRQLIKSLVEQAGWTLEDEGLVPHDLWDAGDLPPLPVSEQLAVLLIGFDLGFEVRPAERVIAIVELGSPSGGAEPGVAQGRAAPNLAVPGSADPPKRVQRDIKQLYTLKVREQTVAVILRELAQRLGWQFEVNEAAIRNAGRSLDARVSFAVENVEADALLNAILAPAGLGFLREGDHIRVIPAPSSPGEK